MFHVVPLPKWLSVYLHSLSGRIHSKHDAIDVLAGRAVCGIDDRVKAA